MKRKLLVFIVTLLLSFPVVIYAIEAVKIQRTENKPYESVAFDIENHKQRFNKVLECKTCHHDETEETKQSCATAECHKGHKGTEVFHKACIGCHKERIEEEAPTRCTQCHKK
jgi:uncharacterized paraquat-inducible protein A